jgi:hypothetical protein
MKIAENSFFARVQDIKKLIRNAKRVYLTYQKWETVSPKLAGSHYCELIKIKLVSQ